MDSPESPLLKRPDGTRRALDMLPASRDEVFRLVRQDWAGPGEYAFVRSVLDSECGELEIAEISLSAGAEDQMGITGLAMGSGVFATSHDIAIYLRRVGRIGARTGLRLSLHVYEDAPDCERDFVWLHLEESGGQDVVEFGLTACGRLSLPGQPESPRKAVYACEVPTVRSALRFVSIAQEVFDCLGVHVRSHPINSRTGDWFS